MGTNFYALRIPTKERKEKLTQLLDSDDFDNIISEIDTTFGKFEMDGDVPKGGKIHLGKRSAGWKFLWNPNMYVIRKGHITEDHHWVWDDNTYYSLYPLTIKGIWNFIKDPNIIIVDESGEKQNKEEFFDMALKWTTWKGEVAWDSKSYREWEISQGNHPHTHKCENNLIDKLISDGYEMISESCTDFYSDGLRFSTNVNFS